MVAVLKSSGMCCCCCCCVVIIFLVSIVTARVVGRVSPSGQSLLALETLPSEVLAQALSLALPRRSVIGWRVLGFFLLVLAVVLGGLIAMVDFTFGILGFANTYLN